MLVYFTFNDLPNGVYQSQVLDTIEAIRKKGGQIRLFAIISFRNFFSNRKLIRKYEPNAIVLPSIGKLRHWKYNRFWLWWFRGLFFNKKVFCRGPMATNLAIDRLSKSRIVYDGRGAVWAEQQEYGVYNGTGIENDIFKIESRAVLSSHEQIAVTDKLVAYWRSRFKYTGENFKVIPCTVSMKGNNSTVFHEGLKDFFSVNKDKTILCFSGGNSKWQAFDKVIDFLNLQLSNNPRSAAILLSPADKRIGAFQNRYGERVINLFVKPEQVFPVLVKCDYGILLREQNITNEVASPIKVAEYLLAGLKVLISPHVGDYSDWIEENGLGAVIQFADRYVLLEKPSAVDKKRNAEFAETCLSKDSVAMPFYI